MRKIWSSLVATALVATMAVAGFNVFEPAAAADPLATVTVKKVSDGTGHGTSAQCWVTSKNGFAVGDNTPSDGVACTNDTVAYEVTVAFKAGPSRVVNLKLSGVPLVSDNTVCRNTDIATATGTDANCNFVVNGGAVNTVTRTVLASWPTEQDAARLTATITDGGTSVSDPVKIVAAPGADIVVDSNNLRVNGNNYSFSLTPKPLVRDGYSATKGAIANTLPWSVEAIEGFPAGTTFKVSGGNLIGNTFTGEQTVNVTLPAGSYPAATGDPDKAFTYHVKLTEDSFSYKGQLNMGSGYDPGSLTACSVSTRDATIGTFEGRLAPNNNCGQITYYAPLPIGSLYNKVMTAPLDPTQDKWAASQKTFTPNGMTRDADALTNNRINDVTAGTQMWATLHLMTGDSTPAGQVAFCDTWTDPLQEYDPTRSLSLIKNGTNTVSSSVYTVRYSLTSSCDKAAWGGMTWTTTPTTAVKTVLVEVNDGVIGPNSGGWSVKLPVKSVDTYASTDGNKTVNNTYRNYITPATGAGTSSNPLTTGWISTFPIAPQETVAITAEKESYRVGDVTSWTVVPAVLNSNILLTAPVVITVDPCIVSPTASGKGYDYEVTPGTATCDNPTGTKTTITATPTSDLTKTWNYNANSAYQLPITVTGSVSNLINNVTAPVQVVMQASVGSFNTSDTAMVLPESQSTSRVISERLEEINTPLDWDVTIARRGVTGEGTSLIILPENGSGAPYTGSDPSNTYPDAKTSNYHGTLRLTSLTLSDSSSGTKLYVHANRNALATDAGWVEVTPTLNLSTYLSVKVVTPGTSVSSANIHVTMTPTGNQLDDVYLLGLTATTSPTDATLAKPWPAEIKVVSSAINGYVFTDNVNVYSWDPSDPPYAGVPVTLWQDGILKASTVTDSNGYYEFLNQNSGPYDVRIDRSAIPATVTSKYGISYPITQTLSYPKLLDENALTTAKVNLPLGSVVPHVDFGFRVPKPDADLDKALVNSVDNGTSVTATWTVDVANMGTMDMTNTCITDRLPTGAYNVKASLAKWEGDGAKTVSDVTADGSGKYCFDTLKAGVVVNDMPKFVAVDSMSSKGIPYNSVVALLDDAGTVWATAPGSLSSESIVPVKYPAPVVFDKVYVTPEGLSGWNAPGMVVAFANGKPYFRAFPSGTWTPISTSTTFKSATFANGKGYFIDAANKLWEWTPGSTSFIATSITTNGTYVEVNQTDFLTGVVSRPVGNTVANRVESSSDYYIEQLNDGSVVQYATESATYASGMYGGSTALVPRMLPATPINKFIYKISEGPSAMYSSYRSLLYIINGVATYEEYEYQNWGEPEDQVFPIGNGTFGENPSDNISSPSNASPGAALTGDVGAYVHFIVDVNGRLWTKNNAAFLNANTWYDRTPSTTTYQGNGKATLTITATINKKTTAQSLSNQAWLSSDQTPYERTPGVFNGYNETPNSSVYGDSTCTTNANLADDTDLCDVVPLSITANSTMTASLSGLVWYDANNNGIRESTETQRLPGVPVQLYRGGVLQGETVTASDGTYSFTGIASASDYQVQFGLNGTKYNGKAVVITAQTPQGATNNDANPATGRTWDVTATGINVDAGVWSPTASIDATKTFQETNVIDAPTLKTGTLPLQSDGKTNAATVTFSFTNNGDEPLNSITVTDTQTGVAIPAFVCTLEGTATTATTVLNVGETVICTATLPRLQAGDNHSDTATVTAKGTLSNTTVTDSDSITITTPVAGPSVTVKKYINDTQWGTANPPSGVATSDTDSSDAQTSATAVLANGATVNTTYVVTNNGNTTLNYVSVYDVVKGVNTPISTSCPSTTLAPGASMTCYGTQTVADLGSTGSEFSTPAYATGLYTATDGTITGVNANDAAWVEVAQEGNADVTVWYSFDGEPCNATKSNCAPVVDVAVSVAGTNGVTDGSGVYTGPQTSAPTQNVSVTIPSGMTVVSTSLDGVSQNGTVPSSVTTVPGETRHVVVVVTATPQSPTGETPKAPVFESGL